MAQALKMRTREGDFRLAYDPQSFVGAKELVGVMKPPGYDSFKPDVEYALKFEDVGVNKGGDLKGRATEYWRGRPNQAPDLGPNVGHGMHDEYLKKPDTLINPGASAPDDVETFKGQMAENPSAMITPVRHRGGVTSVLVPEDVMARTKYTGGVSQRSAIINSGRKVLEAYFDEGGVQRSANEATALLDSYRARYLERNGNRRR